MPVDKPVKRVKAQARAKEKGGLSKNPVTFNALIKDFTHKYEEIQNKLITHNYAHNNWRYYSWSSSQGIYEAHRKDEFIMNYLVPLMQDNTLYMTERGYSDVAINLAAILPPTKGSPAADKIRRHKLASGFDMGTGEVIQWVPAGKDQLFKIDDRGELKIINERTPDYFFTHSLSVEILAEPVKRRPTVWQEFLDQSHPNDPDTWQMIDEHVAGACYTEWTPNVIPFYLGASGSGKGVIPRLMSEFLGYNNTFQTGAFQRLGSRFMSSDFFDKRLIVANDITSVNESMSSDNTKTLFKNMSGDDPIVYEEKGGHSVSAFTNSMLLMTSNHYDHPGLISRADADAWRARLLPVNFQYRTDDEKRVRHLEKKLATPEVLRWCMQQLAAAYVRNGYQADQPMYTRSANSEEMLSRLMPNTVLTLEEYMGKYFVFTDDPKDVISEEEVITLLRSREARSAGITKEMVLPKLRAHMGLGATERPKRRMISGESKHWYDTIKMRPLVEREAYEAQQNVSGMEALEAYWSSEK